MNIAKFKYVIGAAIVMFLFAGTASADGKRGRDHNGGGSGYHQAYGKHQGHGPDYRRPAPYRRPQQFGPKYHHGPQYYHGPKHHHNHARPHTDYRLRHPQPYRAYAPNGGYGVHLSIFDPFFMFGFSSGGRW